MARREKLHAIVLSRRNAGEADRFVTLYTRPHGLLRVYAHGVRRIPSRRGAHLEPLTHVLSIITGSLEHYHLVAVETIDSYLALRRDEQATARLYAVAQAIMGLFHQDDAEPRLFDALLHACQVLPTLPAPKQDTMAVALLLYSLERAGVMPRLDRCQRCASKPAHDAVVLDAHAGGWYCLSCRGSFVGTAASLSPRLLKAVRWLAAYPNRAPQLSATPEDSAQMSAAITRYVSEVIRVPLPYTSPADNYYGIRTATA